MSFARRGTRTIRDAKHVVASIELALAACERHRGKVIVEVVVGPDGPDLV